MAEPSVPAADGFFSGGNTYATGNSVSTTGVTDAAPAAVYQSERYGNFTYTTTGLTPTAVYTVRLHFAEIYWNAAGQRRFNVAINGTQVLTNFDIFATAGANKALVRDLPRTPARADRSPFSTRPWPTTRRRAASRS